MVGFHMWCSFMPTYYADEMGPHQIMALKACMTACMPLVGLIADCVQRNTKLATSCVAGLMLGIASLGMIIVVCTQNFVALSAMVLAGIVFAFVYPFLMAWLFYTMPISGQQTLGLLINSLSLTGGLTGICMTSLTNQYGPPAVVCGLTIVGLLTLLALITQHINSTPRELRSS